MRNGAQTVPNWLYGGIVLLALMIAGGGTYLALSKYLSHGELASKEYYAALQRVEFENRDSGATGLILKENVNDSGLDVLGVPLKGATGTRAWVVLNHTSPDGQVLVIPQNAPLHAPCDLLDRVLSGRRVEDATRQYLLKDCVH